MITVSQTKLAQLLGVSVGRISQLKTDRRLVQVGDGIDLAASLALLRDTADPGKASALRLDRASAWLETALRSAAAATEAEDDADTVAAPTASPAYREARTRKERAMADMAELNYLLAAGELMTLEDANYAIADVGTQVRTAIEISPDRLTPIFVGGSQEEIEAGLLAMLRTVIHDAREVHRRHMALAQQGAVPGLP